MLAEQQAIRSEDQCRAIERSAIPFDHADDKMEGMIPGDRSDEFGCWPRHLDSTFEKTAKLVSAFWGPNSDTHAEIMSLGVTADKCFGKDDKFGTLPGGVCCEVSEFLK